MKISTTEQRLIKTGAGRKRPGIALLNAIVGALACAVVAVAWADDITGKNDVLCASANANVCSDDGSCAPASPWELDIPDFIRFDVKKRRLSTTESSGENRTTDVDVVERTNGRIYLHGLEEDRVFSAVIHEASGFMTVAVVRDGVAVTVFGVCTPTP